MEDTATIAAISAGVMLVSSIVTGLLWYAHRDREQGLLLAIWIGGVVSFASQAWFANAADAWVLLAFGSVFVHIWPFRLLVSEIFAVPARIKAYATGQALGALLSAGLALAGAPFWLAALPVASVAALGIGLPMVAVLRRGWRQRSVPERGMLVTGLVASLHLMDYPFLRQAEKLAGLGFTINLVITLLLTIFGPALIYDRLHRRETRVRRNLDEKERWLSTILGSLADAVIVTDTAGKVQLVNDGAKRLFGVSDADLGSELYQAIQITDASMAAPGDCVRAVLSAGVPIALADHRRVVDPDGRARVLSTLGAPFGDAREAPQGVVLVLRDVTDAEATRSALQQSQRLQAVGTLAAGVAHEVNNPLTAIMVSAQLIERGDAGTETQSTAATIVSESQRIAALVQDLLSLARPDPGPLRATSPAQIVSATFSLTASLVRGEGTQIEVEVPDSLPQISCRKAHMQQVLLNLIANSRHALNQRYPQAHPDKRLRISAAAQDDHVTIVVQDHGGGIAPEVLEHIFDPFYTTKGAGEGTGLGLSISRRLVEEHNGTLWFEVMGETTRALVRLPVRQPVIASAASVLGSMPVD